MLLAQLRLFVETEKAESQQHRGVFQLMQEIKLGAFDSFEGMRIDRSDDISKADETKDAIRRHFGYGQRESQVDFSVDYKVDFDYKVGFSNSGQDAFGGRRKSPESGGS